MYTCICIATELQFEIELPVFASSVQLYGTRHLSLDKIRPCKIHLTV